MGSVRRFVAAALVGTLVVTTTACDSPPPPLWIIDTVAGNGVGGFSGDGGPATEAQINRPYGVVVDAGGSLYVADTVGHRVRKVDPSGTISTVAGTGNGGFSGDGGTATDAELSFPRAVALDGAGNLYIADMGNHRVRMVDVDGDITTFAGSGEHGFAGDGGAAVDAAFQYPADLSFDGSGNLYVADQQNDRIRRVDPAGVITTVAGSGTRSFSGDGGQATDAELNLPEGVLADASGNVYVADTGNNRVRKVDASGVITTVAGSGIGAYYGDGGQATDAGLRGPANLALLANETLVIVDRNNHSLRTVLPSGVITTIAGYSPAPGWGPGQGFDGDGQAPTKAMFDFPRGVAADAHGALYVADERNNRVRKIWPGGGSISGRVVDDEGGSGLGGLVVNVYESSDLDVPVATATTGAGGHYGFLLPTGDYRVEVEGGGGYAGEWFEDASDAASALPVVLTEGDQLRADISLAD